ncbi:hypothetical protein OBBRIDRAFT_111232 [Obba rivulosa]|uniref:Uncharacterized protein n=1 Tax=Obba rivulosa TaxID=1052685 RepID=A0A8E2AU74_9APHY|nr:hypothetical protein OBBRIDRAFT_111232 [Obba rivulosa]
MARSNKRSKSMQRVTKELCQVAPLEAVRSLALIPPSNNKDEMINQLFAERDVIPTSLLRDRSFRTAATEHNILQREDLANETRPHIQAKAGDREYSPHKGMLLRKAMGVVQTADGELCIPIPNAGQSIRIYPSMFPKKVRHRHAHPFRHSISRHLMRAVAGSSRSSRESRKVVSSAVPTSASGISLGPVAGPSKPASRYHGALAPGSSSYRGTNGPVAGPSQSTSLSSGAPRNGASSDPGSRMSSAPVAGPSRSVSHFGDVSGSSAPPPPPRAENTMPVRDTNETVNYTFSGSDASDDDGSDGGHDEQHNDDSDDDSEIEPDSDGEDPFGGFIPYTYPPPGVDEDDPQWLWMMKKQLEREEKMLTNKIIKTRHLMSKVIGDSAILLSRLGDERKQWQHVLQDVGKFAGPRFVKFLQTKMWEYSEYEADANNDEQWESWNGIPDLGISGTVSPCPRRNEKRSRDDSSDDEGSSSDASSASSGSSHSHKRARHDQPEHDTPAPSNRSRSASTSSTRTIANSNSTVRSGYLHSSFRPLSHTSASAAGSQHQPGLPPAPQVQPPTRKHALRRHNAMLSFVNPPLVTRGSSSRREGMLPERNVHPDSSRHVQKDAADKGKGRATSNGTPRTDRSVESSRTQATEHGSSPPRVGSKGKGKARANDSWTDVDASAASPLRSAGAASNGDQQSPLLPRPKSRPAPARFVMYGGEKKLASS